MESVHEPAVAARKRPQGLFVGLCTLDVIQLVDHVPGVNEKLTAREQVVAAGGPAANAAVAFAHLGGSATLLTAIGCHPLGIVVAADLDRLGVNVVDLAAGSVEPPAVSSVLVTASSGDRAVSSTNATAHRLAPPDGLDALVAACDVVEFDGHHLELATAAARAARAAGRRTVLDGGSWKAARSGCCRGSTWPSARTTSARPAPGRGRPRRRTPCGSCGTTGSAGRRSAGAGSLSCGRGPTPGARWTSLPYK